MPALPPLLKQRWQSLCNRLPETIALQSVSEEMQAVIAFSDFVYQQILIHPDWLNWLQTSPPREDEWRNYPRWLQQELTQVNDEASLMQALRLFRQRIMLRIAWLQIPGLIPTTSTLKQLSWLAETLIVAARDWLYADCCRLWGTPCNPQGEAQPLLVLAMGKLGGSELNFSSDIDLIFTWPEAGNTCAGRREMENNQFFTRLGQRLIKVLDQPTEKGFVYRVDMRLRPFGDSGPLVLSFAALEDYYQEQGRDWERYAMVKARIMGDTSDRWSKELYAMLKPFVYRRYIDFSVIQSLRTMKTMISREVLRRGLNNNIKLGIGGIREIEFIVQVFQLIRGGREPALQSGELLPTLETICRLKLLDEQNTNKLRDAYLFLRRLENLLQSIGDQQTQTLPTDELNCTRLAWAMGATNWSLLRENIDQHMDNVHNIFRTLIGGDEEDTLPEQDDPGWGDLWLCVLSHDAPSAVLQPLDKSTREQLHQQLVDLRKDMDKRTIGQRGRQVLDLLMPRLLREACRSQNPAEVLLRLRPLFSAIVTRTTYLELLTETPAALRHLVRLCAASPMIATQLSRYPILLDELIAPATLYHPVAPDAYRDELRQYLLRIPDEDDEQQLDALRQFKQAQLLRVAAADITGSLPVMKVSDQLTWLAQAIIGAVVQQAWWQMTARYGQPQHLRDRDDRGLLVIGYGKLGGLELGYNSDLDLVFLHDCPPDVLTDGKRQIEGRQFYLRLIQRILHLFSTQTSSGILYQVDNRLRPSGAAGLLVTTIDAFTDYQKSEAWTWEHQALVRARAVYGDLQLKKRFDAARRQILRQPREEKKLREDVLDMRKKMYLHLGNKQKNRFDIKADMGGITDIEFITQYLVLRFSHSYPGLVRWSDNVRILELLAQYGIMDAAQAQGLSDAYVTLRNEVHRRALQEPGSHVAMDEFLPERELIKQNWHEWLETPGTSSVTAKFSGLSHCAKTR